MCAVLPSWMRAKLETLLNLENLNVAAAFGASFTRLAAKGGDKIKEVYILPRARVGDLQPGIGVPWEKNCVYVEKLEDLWSLVKTMRKRSVRTAKSSFTAMAKLAKLLKDADEGSLLMVRHSGYGDKETFDNLRGLVRSFISCGAAYVRGNDTLQRQFAPLSNLLLHHVGPSPLEVARMLSAIYVDNRALCEKVPPELIMRLAEHLEKRPCSVEVLDFFGAILDDPAIPRNQKLVMEALIGSTRKHLVVLRVEEGEGEPSSLRPPALREPVFWKSAPLPLRKVEESPHEEKIPRADVIAYCKRLMALLIELAEGRNSLVESKMQVILPIKDLIHDIIVKREPELVCEQLKLLNACYLSTGAPPPHRTPAEAEHTARGHSQLESRPH